MTTKNEALAAIAKSRAGYKDFVKQVDADLRVEKAKRLAAQQGTIYHQVAEAWGTGASIEEIKRAYGTKDYRTIKNIIEAFAVEPVNGPETEVFIDTTPTSWYEIASFPSPDRDGFMYAGENGYDIVLLDDGADIMLVLTGDDDLAGLDGILESETGFSDPGRVELFKAIRAGME